MDMMQEFVHTAFDIIRLLVIGEVSPKIEPELWARVRTTSCPHNWSFIACCCQLEEMHGGVEAFFGSFSNFDKRASLASDPEYNRGLFESAPDC